MLIIQKKITEELHFILRFRVFQHRIKTSECCMIKYMHICAYNVNYHTNRNGMFAFMIPFKRSAQTRFWQGLYTKTNMSICNR